MERKMGEGEGIEKKGKGGKGERIEWEEGKERGGVERRRE